MSGSRPNLSLYGKHINSTDFGMFTLKKQARKVSKTKC